MKKIFKIFGYTIAVILILLITLPILFKGKIEAAVKTKVNETVLAEVNWNKFGLNFFRGFPDLSVNLKGVSVLGIEKFEGDTLVGLDRFELRVKPFSAIKGDIVVEAIILSRPLINGIVLEDSSANWDIMPPPDVEPEEDSDVESGSMNKGLQLKRFSIIDGRIFYEDATSDIVAGIEGLNLDLAGDFSMELTDMILDVSSDAINAKSGGVRYLKDAVFGLHLSAGADMLNSLYTIKESELVLNGLVLGLEGSVSMPKDADMLLDLNFFTRETAFKTLLSMVPAVYLAGFESVKTSGSLQLTGTVKGIMNNNRNPDASLSLLVKDGYFGYPDLPKDVTDIQIGLDLNYNGADEDLTTIDLNKFHFEIAGNPFDLNLHVSNPMSDMKIKGLARGILDFSSLSDVVPLEGVELGGTLETDISLNTRMSYIENEDFENVDLKGKLIVTDVVINTPDLPAPVELSLLDMDFSPKFVSLNTMDAMMGSSDLHMEGKLSNFIPYIFAGKTISGELLVNADLVDVNPFLPQEDEAVQDESKEEELPENEGGVNEIPIDTAADATSMKIPENIDFKMRISLKKVLYDNITIENLNGYIYTLAGIARLDELSMDILDGELMTNGTVNTTEDLTRVNLNLDISGVDIPKSYETFVAVERLAPMAKYCQGTVNTKMTYTSYLDESFEPVYESINARGALSTKGLKIYNLNSFVKLSELLKNEKFKSMAPDEVNILFLVKDGRVIVEPFDIAFDDSKMKVSGSHGIDMTMDYNINMAIARKDLGSGANELLAGVNALAAGAGFKIPESDFVKVKAHIGGTFSDPKISTDLSENLKAGSEVVKAQVKERVEEEIKIKEEEVREQASEEADKIIREAEAEAARLIKQAENAGTELIKESEKQGENLVREAGNNPLKKLAAQKAAEEIKKQAVRQSENLVNEARVKADEIIARAKTEAEKIDK